MQRSTAGEGSLPGGSSLASAIPHQNARLRKQRRFIHIALNDLLPVPQFSVHASPRGAKQQDAPVPAQVTLHHLHVFHSLHWISAGGGRQSRESPDVKSGTVFLGQPS